MSEVLQQVLNGLVLGSIYALISVGLTITFGMLHIIQWAHGEVYMLGAYVTFFCVQTLGLPYYLAILAATLVMGLFGVAMERGVFRPLRPLGFDNSMLGAVGLSIFLLNTSTVLFTAYPRRVVTAYDDIVVSLGSLSLTGQRCLVFVVAVVSILALRLFLRRLPLGKAMRAFEEDREAASLVGVDVNRVATVTLALGSALAGLAGALVGPIFLVHPPMSIMAVNKAFAVVILGGLGNVEGAIAGGFLLGLVETLTAGFISSGYKDTVAFVVLILALAFRPQGLLGKAVPEKV